MNNVRVLLLILMILSGCRQKETPLPVEYTGPLSEMGDVDLMYSEKDHIRVKMKAKKILEYKNGDQEFPEGLYLEFYNEMGVLTSTLKANHAFFFKDQDLWRGREKVEVINLEKKQQLNTEELFWKRDTQKIYTEKFVTIKLENEIIYGTGLDAAQDLSTYTIRKIVNSEFNIQD